MSTNNRIGVPQRQNQIKKSKRLIVFFTLILKCYLHYKTTTVQNVSSEAQVKKFFIS